MVTLNGDAGVNMLAFSIQQKSTHIMSWFSQGGIVAS